MEKIMVYTTEINTEKHILITEKTKRDRLVAQWLIKDNRLVCQWIIVND
jgi:phage anti-repressor protein